ncbi:MAG: putative PEP-binding protein, partial [Conexivisphaera sp.]
GIGLLRIERMFRKPERLEALRRVILAETDAEREKNMKELADMIKPDFKEMLEIMDGKPVVIRLIDPPLHEFLPASEEILSQIYELRMQRQDLLSKGREAEARQLDTKIEELQRLYNRVKALQEANPMMGHRGVRVGVTYPVIYYYLTRAIAEAAAELIKEGKHPVVEIMIPQVADVNEIRFVKNNAILPAIQDVEKEYGVKLNVKIG